jgi:hypothetical protein
MNTEVHTGAAPSFEPDRPSILGVQRFIIVVSIFVAASIIGMKWWLNSAFESVDETVLPGR